MLMSPVKCTSANHVEGGQGYYMIHVDGKVWPICKICYRSLGKLRQLILEQPKSIILKDLLKKFSDKSITKRLLELYPDQKKCKKGYLKALAELRRMRSGKSIMKLEVEAFHEEGMPWQEKGEVDDWVSVFGVEEDQSYALSMTPWSKWLAMELLPNNFSDLDSLCHILWEMTYHGFSSKSVGGFVRLLTGRMKDIKSEIKNDHKK